MIGQEFGKSKQLEVCFFLSCKFIVIQIEQNNYHTNERYNNSSKASDRLTPRAFLISLVYCVELRFSTLPRSKQATDL